MSARKAPQQASRRSTKPASKAPWRNGYPVQPNAAQVWPSQVPTDVGYRMYYQLFAHTFVGGMRVNGENRPEKNDRVVLAARFLDAPKDSVPAFLVTLKYEHSFRMFGTHISNQTCIGEFFTLIPGIFVPETDLYIRRECPHCGMLIPPATCTCKACREKVKPLSVPW